MTIQFLKYIVAAAEIGSITEAAKQIHISQPSLSAALKEAGGDAVGRSPCLARKSRDLPVRSLLFSAYEAPAGEQVRMLTRKAVNARRKRSAVLYVYGIDDILSVQKSVRRMDRDRLSKNTIPRDARAPVRIMGQAADYASCKQTSL